MSDSDSVRAVDRAVDILFSLAERPQTLTSLSHSSNLSKPTCRRLLFTLVARGLVAHDPEQNLYAVGPAFYLFIEALHLRGGGLALIADDIMHRLRDQTGETVALHVANGLQRFCVLEWQSTQPLRYAAGVGSLGPLTIGATGKVLLAFMKDGAMQGRAPLQLHITPELEEEIEQVRAQGYGESYGERVPGAMGLSVPVVNDSGLLAALTLIAPESRMPPATVKKHLGDLLDAAAEISMKLSR